MPLFLTILFIVIIFAIWRSAKNKSIVKKIKANPQMTFATITKYKGLRYGIKNNIWFYYEYTAGNVRYKARTRNYHKAYRKENFKYLYGKTFSFIYCTKNPSLGRLLITADDFKIFDLKQPSEFVEFNNKLLF